MSSNYPTDKIICWDLEVFPGYFLAGFQLPSGEVFQFEVTDTFLDNVESLQNFLIWTKEEGYTLAGFNTLHYDSKVLTAFMKDPTPATAYKCSVDIILNEVPSYSLEDDVPSVDLMQILPGRIGLKKIGVCLGHSKLQELPIPFDKTPTPEEQGIIEGYNVNDLQITRKLLNAIQPELDLRATMSDRYQIDMRSKGEATMAEAAIMAEYQAKKGTKTKRDLNSAARAIIAQDPMVQVFQPGWWGKLDPTRYPALYKVIPIGDELFRQKIPVIGDYLSKGIIDRQLFLGDRYYAMGIGGLHSVDGPGCWIPKDDEFLVDIDVASYYPNIILTQQLAPRQWSDKFLPIYQDIVDRRMKAKRAGDKVTANILKISANGTYGKTSDPFSALYDPQMTANVTVLGQLGLLALIAMLDGVGTVVSANTDGVSVLGKIRDLVKLKLVVGEWEETTGLEMEYTYYDSIHQSDCNNYLAVTEQGTVKEKGRFNTKSPDLRHTPNARIVPLAIRGMITKGIPLAETIYGSNNIQDFILTQSVSNGWETAWNDKPLGRMLRFYKSNRPDATSIIRTPTRDDIKGNAGNVPNSEGCVPLPDLPEEFPEDMNYAWYIQEAVTLWEAISVPKRRNMNQVAELMHDVGLRPCYVNPDAKTYSRAGVKYGETDFSSCPPGWVMGTGTGNGLMARVSDDQTMVFTVTQHYPSRTRKKVQKDLGITLLYGARVPLKGSAGYIVHQGTEGDLDELYTAAELKKVKR